MKRLIFAILFAGVLVACREDVGYVGTERMLIASKIATANPPLEFWGSRFYYVKRENINDRNWQKNGEWQLYSIYDLKGFEHKDGYESLIEVNVYRNFTDDDPLMDAPMYNEILKQIISREKKDSEGLPPLEINIEQ